MYYIYIYIYIIYIYVCVCTVYIYIMILFNWFVLNLSGVNDCEPIQSDMGKAPCVRIQQQGWEKRGAARPWLIYWSVLAFHAQLKLNIEFHMACFMRGTIQFWSIWGARVLDFCHFSMLPAAQCHKLPPENEDWNFPISILPLHVCPFCKSILTFK